MEPDTPTMFQWMFKADSALDKTLRRGAAGLIAAAVFAASMKQIAPTTPVTIVTCLLISAVLATLPLLSSTPPKDPALRGPVGALGVAFGFMTLLFLIDAIYKLPKGYEPATDALSTLFFAVAWFFFSRHEQREDSQDVDRVSIVLVSLLVIGAAVARLLVLSNGGDPGPAQEANASSARLLLNVANGAVFLGLYGQLRRIFPPPDPITHIVILLFGCAQIAAHGRDCVGSAAGCQMPVEFVVAHSIAWVMLLGKFAIGLYVVYLYFNASVSGAQGKIPGLYRANPSELARPLR